MDTPLLTTSASSAEHAADNQIMTQSRQPAGVPTGGEFASNAHDEAGALSADTAAVLPEDTQWAQQQIVNRLEREGFTAGGIEMVLPSKRDEIEAAAKRRAEHLAPLRAFHAGIPHPTDADFEEMWEGEGGLSGRGFSRADAEFALASIHAAREADTQTALGERAMDAQETFWTEAMESHGRSLGVNQGLALNAKADATR